MVTIKAVAERAGVSPSTVSRTLSGKIPVDESTREKVMKAVKELNYYPNALAKGLKEGKTNTIALVVPNIQNQIFPMIAKGVEDYARKNGITLILCNTDEDINIELQYVDKLKKSWIDGFIFATAVPSSTHIIKLRESGFPVVLVARTLGNVVDAVTIDNFKSSFEAVNFLIKTGHRNIAIINGPLEVSIYKHRFEGYKAALEHGGIEFKKEIVIQGDSMSNTLYSMVYNMLERKVKIDAVYATSDPRAIIAMKAIKDFRLRIPQDISVVGFDNMEISTFVDPPLTTISQPLYEMGSMAARKLIAMIGKGSMGEPIIDILPTDLIIRKSTK